MADNTLQQLKDAVIDGQHLEAVALTKQLLAAQTAPRTILDEGLIAGMAEVGELFKEGEFFVPEMLISARAMQSAMAVLRPILVDTGVKPIGTVILGTVQGDLHDIGKNLTGMFLEGAGFRVVDLGVDVSADKFAAAIQEHQADILGMSSLLTTTMTYTAQVMKKLQEENLRGQVKVIVGGAPITQDWANHIGADTFALDAATAAEKCKVLMGAVH